MADTDRELLEAAAKAAGLNGFVLINGVGAVYDTIPGILQPYRDWNPITDDGDAFRLAVKLRLDLTWTRDARDRACASRPNAAMGGENAGSDANAAMRLAIVRAAAAIGGCNG